MQRLNILDIWVDNVDEQKALEQAATFLRATGGPKAIFASNPEKQFLVSKNPLLYQAYREAGLLLPDGIGMVLPARILHKAKLQRVPGSEFIFGLCGLASREGKGIFVYGSREEVNQNAIRKLKKRFPDLIVSGRQNGYIPDSEMPSLIRRINESKAAILFLALGSPKQEVWFAKYKHELKTVRVCQGVGGTLDTIAGYVRRAPAAWCRLNLEWLYRLLREPQRIKRQKMLPVFAAMVFQEALRTRLLPKAERSCEKHLS